MFSTNRGIATLLFTSLVLMASLLLTLTMHRSSLVNIKVINNRLEASRSYWIAQGGLHCVFGQIRLHVSTSIPFHHCGLPEGLTVEVIKVGESVYQLKSTYSFRTAIRAVKEEHGQYQWLQGSWRDYE